MKLTKKQFQEFLDIMDYIGEPLFGTKKQIKEQAEMLFDYQGYWSATDTRVYFKDNKFIMTPRW